jgi:hypothetical protein
MAMTRPFRKRKYPLTWCLRHYEDRRDEEQCGGEHSTEVFGSRSMAISDLSAQLSVRDGT